MLDNLRIALRKQKKLLILFFLTIFLPAASLSVFGIRAIRNERFRLAKQDESEGRRAARFVRSHFHSTFEDLSVELDGLVQNPSFLGMDYLGIHGLVEKRFAADPLIEQVFVLYKGEEPVFPFFQIPAVRSSRDSFLVSDTSVASKKRRAEESEFVEKSYRSAASLYRELSQQIEDRNFKAEMLTGQARCYQKAGLFERAIEIYARINNDFSDCATSSGLPLGLLAKLQIVGCYEKAGDFPNAGTSAMSLYQDLLQTPSTLSEDQFKTYASLVQESIEAVLSEGSAARSFDDLRIEFANLQELWQVRTEDWEAADRMKKEVIPELERRLSQSDGYKTIPYRFSRDIDGRDCLVLAVWIPDRYRNETLGVFGVQIDDNHLLRGILPAAELSSQLNDGLDIILSDLSGRKLTGEGIAGAALPLATEFFEANFPPWKIEVFQTRSPGLGIIDIRKSFYFWTILTLIVVLAFGAFLIVRTIAHEMEILKIKSDFVASVSHEFKTPLTSIKALMERLSDGRVQDPHKIDQYHSVISQDAEKLTRLVNNLLDFSKIEEGKKEYVFKETDVVRIVRTQVEGFKKEQLKTGPVIRLEIANDIPHLRMDEDAFSQALINLLGNAIKFTPPGKSIQISLRSDKERVILAVKDEGIGIHPDELGKIFEKFYQGKNALNQSVKGTGLGLTLVKHIVEAHGGSVLVESEPGKGSQFSMVFPIGK